jgi:hypothetical protein
VQLGTNWFDLLEQRSDPETIAKLTSIVERFAESVQNADFHAELIWITPPDSARFKNVQGTVNELIKSVARRRRFRCIDSSQMVHYVPGQSGHDGVHYSGAAAEKWASGVKAWIVNQL